MTATLYLPQEPPQPVSPEGFEMPDSATGLVGVPALAPIFLGCAPELVDVLASGPDYVVYSIFDCEDEVNQAAMDAVATITGVSFDIEDEDDALHGTVLVISNKSR